MKKRIDLVRAVAEKDGCCHRPEQVVKLLQKGMLFKPVKARNGDRFFKKYD